MGTGSLGMASQLTQGLGAVEAIGGQAGAGFCFQLRLHGLADGDKPLPALAPVEGLDPPFIVLAANGWRYGLEPVGQAPPVFRLDQGVHGGWHSITHHDPGGLGMHLRDRGGSLDREEGAHGIPVVGRGHGRPGPGERVVRPSSSLGKSNPA